MIMYSKAKSAAAVAVLMAGTLLPSAVIAQGTDTNAMPGANDQTQGQMMSGGDQNSMGTMGGQNGAMGGGMGGQNGGMGQMMMMQMMMQNMQLMMQDMQNMGAGQNGMGSSMGGQNGAMGTMGGQNGAMGGAQGMWADKSPEAMKNFVTQMPADQRQMLLQMLEEMGSE